jgi:hypothetical protein
MDCDAVKSDRICSDVNAAIRYVPHMTRWMADHHARLPNVCWAVMTSSQRVTK